MHLSHCRLTDDIAPRLASRGHSSFTTWRAIRKPDARVRSPEVCCRTSTHERAYSQSFEHRMASVERIAALVEASAFTFRLSPSFERITNFCCVARLFRSCWSVIAISTLLLLGILTLSSSPIVLTSHAFTQPDLTMTIRFKESRRYHIMQGVEDEDILCVV